MGGQEHEEARADEERKTNLLSVPALADTTGRHKVGGFNVEADDSFKAWIARRRSQLCLIGDTLGKEQVCGGEGKTSRDYNLLSIPTIPEAAGGTGRGLRVEAIDDVEDAEVIPREEGVCRFCFRMLKGDDNILKTKCGCRLTLMHTECANTQWPSSAAECSVCKQDVQTVPVIIRDIITPYSEFHPPVLKSTPAEIKYKIIDKKYKDQHSKIQKPTPTESKNDKLLKVQKPTSTETKNSKEREQSPKIKLQQKPAPTNIRYTKEREQSPEIKVQRSPPTNIGYSKEQEQSPEIKVQKSPPTNIGNEHGRRCCIM